MKLRESIPVGRLPRGVSVPRREAPVVDYPELARDVHAKVLQPGSRFRLARMRATSFSAAT